MRFKKKASELAKKQGELIVRKLIAYITGWPLVSFNFAGNHRFRFVKPLEDGSSYVIICGIRKEVMLYNSYHQFKPVMNCRKHNIPLFSEDIKQ